MDRASNSSSTGWEIISGNHENPASVSEVMAGSFCREKQIINILEVKADESDYLLRFKDGSEEWVANEELDETTKEFFKLAKPVKRALNIHSRKQIKIQHVETEMIYKISTSGINNVQELKKRYTDNAGCNVEIDLYTMDQETDQLLLLAPETLLPLRATKVFAKNSPKEPIYSSKAYAELLATIEPVSSADIPPLEMDEEEKMSSIASKSTIALLRKELTTKEAAREVLGAVGGSGGKGISKDGILAGSRSNAPVEAMPVASDAENPNRMKVTDSICAKMSDAQKMKLAIKMSDGTLTCQDLQDAINSNKGPGGPADVIKHIVTAFQDFFGNRDNQEKGQVNAYVPKNSEPKAEIVQGAPAPPTDVSVPNSIHIDDSKEESVKRSDDKSVEVSAPEAKVVDQEQKPVEEPEDLYDIVIEANSVEKKAQLEPVARPIIHSQPVFDNSPDNLNEWLQSLGKINVKKEIQATVEEKINEIETAHVIKLSEIENRHNILVTSLRAIIKRQAAEKSELALIMRQNKKAVLTAIEAQLDKYDKKFAQNYEGFFHERKKQLENLNNNLEQKALASIQVGEKPQVMERKAPVFQRLELRQENLSEKKQIEPKVVIIDEKPAELLLIIKPEEPKMQAHKSPNCPGEHGLKMMVVRWSDIVACDKCQERIKANTELFTCRSCNYDICARCYGNQEPKKSHVELEISPRAIFEDDDGHDSKELDDVHVEEIGDFNQPSFEELKDAGMFEDEEAKEEFGHMKGLENSLELVSVELTKGGYISELMHVNVEMKNVGPIPIQCVAALTSKIQQDDEGDNYALRFIGFKTSLQEDKQRVRLDIAPGDVFTAVIEFLVPQHLKPNKYDFEWQLIEFQTGEKVGPCISLVNVQIYKSLEIAEQEEKVRRFCSMGFGSREKVIEALDSNGWDLNQAVNAFIPQ